MQLPIEDGTTELYVDVLSIATTGSHAGPEPGSANVHLPPHYHVHVEAAGRETWVSPASVPLVLRVAGAPTS